MLPPFSWSFIPMYWQEGKSKKNKIMKVCKWCLLHGSRFFIFKIVSLLFVSFCFYCCVRVGDTTGHWWQRHVVGRLKSLRGTMCLYPGRPSRKTASSEVCSLPHCQEWHLRGWLPMFAPSYHAHIAQRASGRVSSVRAGCFTMSGGFYLCVAL